MAERVLVSGGSGGIGAAVAAQLARRGRQPVIGYANNRPAAVAAAEACGATTLHLDLADTASIDDAIARLQDDPSPLTGIVLAGAMAPQLQRFGQIDDTDLAAHLQVAAIGPRRLLAGVVQKLMRPHRRGTVVGVLSAAMGTPEQPATASMGAYVIAKYAMQGVLTLLAVDYPWLQVHTVSPGFTDTGMLDAFDSRFVDALREQGKVASAVEVAGVISQHFEAITDGSG